MKRSVLFSKIWSTPMTKVAAEVGISGGALAKICAKHRIPTPTRGYWAKLKAGQSPEPSVLPDADQDIEIILVSEHPRDIWRRQQMAEKEERAQLAKSLFSDALPAIVFAKKLDDAHPLVHATWVYCQRLTSLIDSWKRRKVGQWDLAKIPPPERFGRYNFSHHGGLNITASLAVMDWVLRFHTTILDALERHGATIVRRQRDGDRRDAAYADFIVEIRYRKESLALSFSEGYQKVRYSAKELVDRKKDNPWAKDSEMVPSGVFTFTVRGTELQIGDVWRGEPEKLEGLVEAIVRKIFEMASVQSTMRNTRLVREQDAARVASEEADRRRKRAAREEQVKQAYAVMDAGDRASRLLVFLDRLREHVDGFEEPMRQRAMVWSNVVREELAGRKTLDAMLEKILTVPSWGRWPPDWWPDNVDS